MRSTAHLSADMLRQQACLVRLVAAVVLLAGFAVHGSGVQPGIASQVIFGAEECTEEPTSEARPLELVECRSRQNVPQLHAAAIRDAQSRGVLRGRVCGLRRPVAVRVIPFVGAGIRILC